MKAIKVLLVEDNPADARLLRELLADAPSTRFEFAHVERLSEALHRLGEERFDIVLLDLGLPDTQGLDTFRAAHAWARGVPIVIMTGLDDETLAVNAVQEGAQDYLCKGRVDSDLLVRAMRYAIERQRADEQIKILAKFPSENPSPVFRVARDGTVLYANRASSPLLAMWELGIGQSLPDPWLPSIRDVLSSGLNRDLEVQLGDRTFSFVVAPVVDAACVYLYGLDVTERKRLEQQVLQAQKMEAVGRLASGVAHDFNNLLTVITGRCEFLLQSLGERHLLARDVAEIKRAADRAAALTNQLLAFSRRQVLQPKVLELNAVVANLDRMLRRLIGEDITLITAPDPALKRIKADPSQVEQVILNLVVNARDAMPQGGRLTIETANVEFDEAYVRRHVPAQPGAYVMLAVSDTGCGMDAETQSHIFEPFFTTKEQGKGTGLGLSTVYGIVKQSGGFIWVYSAPGLGTTFKVYLPQTDEAGEALPADRPRTAVPRGSETVLLVEDEAMLRELAREMLQLTGYLVLEAANGREALRICERYTAPIHLLVTDVVMPEMSARELSRRVALLHPETKVLYMSGYAENAVVHHGVVEPGTAFLAKPFTRAALAAKVREVLDTFRPESPRQTLATSTGATASGFSR